jgi:hypothetical protein
VEAFCLIGSLLNKGKYKLVFRHGVQWVGMQRAKVTDIDFPKLPLQFIKFLSKESGKH